ncbi:ORF1331 [White spot syndrome virus]|uniref:ORF1331 n=1 Tax=White spot syndrome virus TaxID=342409 RepID=A0A2D3I617_9VIRU|nr:ORF1331 [White spot syndrome virus]
MWSFTRLFFQLLIIARSFILHALHFLGVIRGVTGTLDQKSVSLYLSSLSLSEGLLSPFSSSTTAAAAAATTSGLLTRGGNH